MKEITVVRFLKIFKNLNCRFLSSAKLFIAIVSIGLSSGIYGQTLPPESDCVSKDLLVVRARLDAPVCVECQEGDVKLFPLVLSIDNKTGSFRPTFAFFGTLEVTNNGQVTEYPISGCNDSEGLPAKTITDVYFQDIAYTCGTSLKLTNLYLAWTDASKVTGPDSKNSCENLTTNINSSGYLDISPKCGTLDEIKVDTPLSAEVTAVTDVSCYGGSDGSINISVFGGEAPYSYNWADLPGTNNPEDRSNLSAGFYSVVITDNKGCTYSISDIEIDEPDELDAEVESDNIDCYGGSDGSITISNPVGGSGNYEYSINGGISWQNSGSFTGLSVGAYEVQIRDANATNCVVTLNEDLMIAQADELDADVDSDDVSCYGGSDGSITISNPSGGSGNYQYSIDGGSTWQDDGSFTGLSADSYDVKIRDKDVTSCVVTLINDLEIGQPNMLSATVNSEDVKCNGEAGGSISIINPSGGSGDYEFSIDGGSNWQESGSFTGLPAGFYNVQIRDANAVECIVTLNENLEIEQPFILAADLDSMDVSCYGENDGSISILNPTGGSGSYEFSINGGSSWQSSGSFTGLMPDSYNVQIRDANFIECVITLDDDLVIEEPPLLDQPSLQIPPNECFSDPGNFVITSNTEGLLFQIDDGDFIAYPDGGFVGIPVGMHTITAKNEDGCLSVPLAFEIFPPLDTPVMPILDAIQPTCDILTGTILVTNHVEGQTYYVRLASDIPNPVFVAYPAGGFSGLAPGDYVVLARSADECSSDAAFISLVAATNCDDFEGCTLGYWKNHTDRWCSAYETCDLYGDVFESAPSNLAGLTLQEVLNLKGNTDGENLARQSVAALLNICNEDVNYDSEFASVEALQEYVNSAFNEGNINMAGSHLDYLNNAGCSLGGSRANTSSNCTNLKVSSADNSILSSFSASPVPFKESLNIQYDFNYSSPATIQMFDLQGRLLRTYKEANAYKGKITELKIDFRTMSSQVYILKVTTDRDVFTKNIISDK